MAKTASKKRKVIVESIGEAHVTASFNNIIISLTNTKGEVISWSSAATITSPIFAFSAFLNTCEIIDKPFIFRRGLPGSLVADSLDGIIINVFILFFC